LKGIEQKGSGQDQGRNDTSDFIDIPSVVKYIDTSVENGQDETKKTKKTSQDGRK